MQDLSVLLIWVCSMSWNDTLTASIQASMIGFHDPRKHHRMRERAFLEAYKAMLRGGNKPEHEVYLSYVLDHEVYFLSFIRRTLTRHKRVL